MGTDLIARLPLAGAIPPALVLRANQFLANRVIHLGGHWHSFKSGDPVSSRPVWQMRRFASFYWEWAIK